MKMSSPLFVESAEKDYVVAALIGMEVTFMKSRRGLRGFILKRQDTVKEWSNIRLGVSYAPEVQRVFAVVAFRSGKNFKNIFMRVLSRGEGLKSL